MKNADMPAMPQSVSYGPDGSVVASYDFAGGAGLTKREHFAAMAMPRIETYGNADDFAQTAKTVAQLSVALADATLAELERTS